MSKARVWGREMVEIPRAEWPVMLQMESVALSVWRSRDYLAVLYKQRADGNVRLTVNSVRRDAKGRWRDGITWDELQRIKNECLGEDACCIEVYPAESDLVNVSNMRHLWVLDGPCEKRFPKESVWLSKEAE